MDRRAPASGGGSSDDARKGRAVCSTRSQSRKAFGRFAGGASTQPVGARDAVLGKRLVERRRLASVLA
jgi:hypothetical protein